MAGFFEITDGIIPAGKRIQDAGGWSRLTDGRVVERRPGESVWRDKATGEIVELPPSPDK